MSQAVSTRAVSELLQWPAQGLTRVPLQVFAEPGLYAWEQDLIFRGPTWSFLGLEVEIPDYTDKGDQAYDSGMIRAMKNDYGLKDPSLIDQWMEFPDQITNSIQSIFPGFVLQQILNSIGTRQIITRGVNHCELVWTLLGFEEDTEEQAYVRIKQSNLVGPAGLVSMEDGAIGGFVQKGIRGDLRDADIQRGPLR